MTRTRLLTIAGVATVYIVSGLAMQLFGYHGDTLLIWPPTGVALAAALLLGVWVWPAVAIGTFATVLLTGHPVVAAGWISLVDVLEVVLAHALLRRAGFRGSLGRVRDVLALAAVSFGVSFLSAAASMFGLHAAGLVAWERVQGLFATWWWCHASADLVVVPLLLSRRTRRAGDDVLDRARPLEAAMLALGILVVDVVVFAQWLPVWLLGSFSPHYLLPMLMWAAIRFGTRGAALANFAVSMTAVASVSLGGPIGHEVELHTFISISTVATLLLSASVTERVHAMMRRSAFERTALDAIISVDHQFRIVELNPAAVRMFGWPASEALGADVTRLLSPPRLLALHQESLQKLDRERQRAFVGRRIETYMRRANGSEVPVEVALTNVALDGEQLLTGMIRDLSAARAVADVRKQAFDALEEVVEARTAALVQTNQELERRGELLKHAERLAQLGSFELHLETGTFEWSDELFGIFGVDRDTFVPTLERFLDAMHPDDRAHARSSIERAIARGGSWGIEVRIIRPDGSIRTLRTRGHVHDVMSGCCQDITEQKEAEEARYRLANIAAFSEDAIIGLRPDGTIETWNAGAARLLGYATEEVAGRSCILLVDDSEIERLHGIIRRVVAGEHVAHYEMLHRRSDGTPFEGSVTTSAIRGATGSIIGISNVMRDISARKAFEDQLRASLDEKEVLLREIHHRVKNNLQVISSLLNLQASRQTSELARRGLVESQSRVQSMALVHQLLYQSKDLGRIDFGAYLRALSRTLLATYHVGPARIEITVDGPPIHLDIHKAVPSGLVVNELIANAIDHAFTGRDRGHIHVRMVRRGAHRLAIIVADDGVGMPAHAMADPAHTFGLRIARTLAKQLGGTLDIANEGGARLSLELSIAARADETVARAAAAAR